MAIAHNIETTQVSLCHPFDSTPFVCFQSEKISCSINGISSVEPTRLLGRHVLLEEYLPAAPGASGEVVSYGCTVVGVIHGVPSLGTFSELIVRHDGFDGDERARISHLTVMGVD